MFVLWSSIAKKLQEDLLNSFYFLVLSDTLFLFFSFFLRFHPFLFKFIFLGNPSNLRLVDFVAKIFAGIESFSFFFFFFFVRIVVIGNPVDLSWSYAEMSIITFRLSIAQPTTSAWIMKECCSFLLFVSLFLISYNEL